MNKDTELYVIFDSQFLEDIEVLGYSANIYTYCRFEAININSSDVNYLLSATDNELGYYDDINKKPTTTGFWDSVNKEFHIYMSSLPVDTYSNKVKKIDGIPVCFEFDSVNSFGINNGDDLIRLIRFYYTRDGLDERVAFILTSNISIVQGLVLDPIRFDQDKTLLTIKFPETTKANINPKKVSKDVTLLEGASVFRGINLFNGNPSDNTIVTRNSSFRYLDYKVGNTTLERKDLPYIGNDGQNIYSRGCFRLYTGVRIFCSNMINNMRPKTRASLNKSGGILKIYGTLEYVEYEYKNNEYIYIGKGTESIEGISDVELILTTHLNGLNDVRVSRKFYVSYGAYEEQDDPSVLVKARVSFYNPFTKEVEVIESADIKLTQEENIMAQWEVIRRSTPYVEPTIEGDIPVYVFPWESGKEHSFIIRTTLPDLNPGRDFIMEYEDPTLEDLFDYSIREIPGAEYPITNYMVTLTTKIDNNDKSKWLPMINGESVIKLSTLFLENYGYFEPFYCVQSPNAPGIELHDASNNNVESILLENNQDVANFYPVAEEARDESYIGERNTWKYISNIFSRNVEQQMFSDAIFTRISFTLDNNYGLLNPNNDGFLEHALTLRTNVTPTTLNDVTLGSILLGRVLESSGPGNFSIFSWRDAVGMSTVSVLVRKKGVDKRIELPEEYDAIVFKEINLYKVNVISNGPFACWMDESDDYCFFDPSSNQLTNTNYYYSTDYDESEGVFVYIALHNVTNQSNTLEELGDLLFSVQTEEPDWSNGKPDCFEDQSNLAICKLYQQRPDNISVSYLNQGDCYVFIGTERKGIKFKSTETPRIDPLYTYDGSVMAITDTPEPVFTISDNYRYHVNNIQNSGSINELYPVGISSLYKARSWSLGSELPFYIFRKAKDPYAYINGDQSTNILLPAELLDPDADRPFLKFRSRYIIEESDIITSFQISDSFEINISYTELENVSDCKYEYTIELNPLQENTEEQRYLGYITITPRIYNLIDFTYFTNYGLPIPFQNLSQNYIDSIVSPGNSLVFQIYQEAGEGGGGGGETDWITIGGNFSNPISPNGDSRLFSITSQVPVSIPVIFGVTNCTVTGISASGFTFNAESIINGYSSVIPSSTDSYTSYYNDKIMGFKATISPEDTSSEYQPYTKSFSFRQSGISKGLVYAFGNNSPELYLGSNNIITEYVESSATHIDIFLGAFSIQNRIVNGTAGTFRDISITGSQGFSYEELTSECIYNDSGWSPNIRISFTRSDNRSEKVFNISFSDRSGFTHSIELRLRIPSSSGDVICKDSAYFLSSGHCVESDDYSVNLGYFTFETNISPITDLTLSIPDSFYDEVSSPTYIGEGSREGYSRYKVKIILKPNLSNIAIQSNRNQIFSFKKNGVSVANVYINQGYYSLKINYPNSNIGVVSGGTLGSISEPIKIPSRDNTEIGTRAICNMSITRCEPKPSTGRFVVEDISFDSITFPEVKNYTWSNVSDLTISGGGGRSSSTVLSTYLERYETALFNDNNNDNVYLENLYTVRQNYYTQEIIIKAIVNISVSYPNEDTYLRNITTIHNYTMYLKKVAEEDDSSNNNTETINTDNDS